MASKGISIKAGNKRLIKIEFPTISLAIVVVLNLYYLYLLDPDVDTVAGFIAQDFALVVAMVWGAYYWFRMMKMKNPVFRYGNWMITFIVLSVLSAFQSTRLYGQGFMLGFAPQRWVLIWAFLYFPIRKLIYYRKISIEGLLTVLKIIAALQLALFIAQYFVGSSATFLYSTIGTRNGRSRYYYGPILLDLFFLICLDDFVTKKGFKRFMAGVLAALVLFETMFVQQFRLTSMGLIICLALFVVFMRTKRQVKVVYFIVGAVALVILFNTTMVQNVLETVLTNSYDSGTKIRWVGKALYMETLMKHSFLGGGYPSSYYNPARQAAGMNNLIYLYDNGVMGFLYIYGTIGLVWVVSLWRKLVSDGLVIYKRMKDMAYFLFPVFFIITSINELHWYWEYGFVVFSLFLCLIETKISEGEQKK